MVERTRIAFFICAVGSPKGKYGGMDKDVIRRIATNVPQIGVVRILKTKL